jgi:hypothetical protein
MVKRAVVKTKRREFKEEGTKRARIEEEGKGLTSKTKVKEKVDVLSSTRECLGEQSR